MSRPSATDPAPQQRRSPRFSFDSLVRLTVSRPGEQPPLWGGSTDLCRQGIGGMLVIGD